MKYRTRIDIIVTDDGETQAHLMRGSRTRARATAAVVLVHDRVDGSIAAGIDFARLLRDLRAAIR